MNIPDEALKAAAEAMNKVVPNSDGVLWEFDEVVDREIGGVQRRAVTLTDAARAAIEAAMPAINDAIKQDLKPVAALVSTYRYLHMDTPEDQALLNRATTAAERALAVVRGPICGYCGGSGWSPGCGDQTCCPPGPCASCDGTGTPKDRP